MRKLNIKRVSIIAEPSKGFATKVKINLSFGGKQEEITIHFCPEGNVNLYYSHFLFYGLNEQQVEDLEYNLKTFYEKENVWGKEKINILQTVVIGLEQMFKEFNEYLTDIVASYEQCSSEEKNAVKVGNMHFVQT